MKRLEKLSWPKKRQQRLTPKITAFLTLFHGLMLAKVKIKLWLHFLFPVFLDGKLA